jgi:predicted DNA-binding transcriptional regulator AlpA
MEKLVLDEHDLSARWGVNVKTLKRWRNEGRGPRYIKIGRSVTYLPKDIEHFETHALFGRSRGAVEPLQMDMSTQPSSRAVVTARPRSPQQEIVDLMAVALLRLRAAGPPPITITPSQTPTVNEVGKDEPVRRRFGVRVLTRMTDED